MDKKIEPVKRYTFTGLSLVENEGGGWIDAADYDTLLAEVEELKADRDSWEVQASDRVSDWDEMRMRAWLAEADAAAMREVGKRVTDAFRAHGESNPFTKEADRTRHECEQAILALDTAMRGDSKCS
jgi:hypothetical protein